VGVPANRLKQIRRGLQHRHEHRTKLCKVYDKWDRNHKGGLDSADVVGMMAELGMEITEEEAKAFVHEIQPDRNMITLENFLKTVEEPKRKSYYSNKNIVPLHIMESEELDQAGGYLAVFREKYQKTKENIKPSVDSAVRDNTMKSQLLQKYHLEPVDYSKKDRANHQKSASNLSKGVNSPCLTGSVVIDK
jgi:hypothetical protein